MLPVNAGMDVTGAEIGVDGRRIAIGGDRAIAADPAILGSALRSLTDLGLEADSRRIAREIAVLAGL